MVHEELGVRENDMCSRLESALYDACGTNHLVRLETRDAIPTNEQSPEVMRLLLRHPHRFRDDMRSIRNSVG
jgi:hypothetical protein